MLGIPDTNWLLNSKNSVESKGSCSGSGSPKSGGSSGRARPAVYIPQLRVTELLLVVKPGKAVTRPGVTVKYGAQGCTNPWPNIAQISWAMLTPRFERAPLSVRMKKFTVLAVTVDEIPASTQLVWSLRVARPALMKCCAAAQKSGLPRPGWLKANPLLKEDPAKW